LDGITTGNGELSAVMKLAAKLADQPTEPGVRTSQPAQWPCL